MSHDRNTEMGIKGTARKWIMQNFVRLKHVLVTSNTNGIIKKSHEKKLIDDAAYQIMKDLPNYILQVECILKTLTETDDEKCLNFLSLFTDVNISMLMQDKTVPEEAKRRYQNVTKDQLYDKRAHIQDQLEIRQILDSMLEYDVITVRNHDEIQESKGRRKKVETFLNCVFGKKQTDWIHKFLYVLELTGYSSLSDELVSPAPFSPIEDHNLPIGNTMTLTTRLRALTSNTERCLLENNGSLIDEAVQCVLSNHLLNLKEGSIYLQFKILNNKALVQLKSAADTMASLLRKLMNNEKVKESITEKTPLIFDIEEVAEDAFFNENCEEELDLKTVGPTYGKQCSRCIQKTMKVNHRSILDEIETDTIVKTLENAEGVTNYIRHKCIYSKDKISRTERAKHFLEYAMTRENIIQKLMHVLNEQQIDLEEQTCSECSGIPRLSSDYSKKRTMIFQIEKDEYGEVIVELSNDTFPEGIQLYGNGVSDIEEEHEEGNKQTKFVGAIDIGTSYSGYAYSTVQAYQENPLDIKSIHTVGSRQCIPAKVPSYLLMTKDKKLVSFGYDAETDYIDLIAERKEGNFYFFDKFKIDLYKSELAPEQIEIKDIHGYAVAAVDVLALAIKALKKDFEKKCNEKVEKIKWVVTIPNVGTSAIELIGTCAEKAGIRKAELSIALESDAASIYHLYQSNAAGRKSEKYLIVDIGGGAFNISVHERTMDNKLRELCSPCGCAFDKMVNENFLDMLTEISGPNVTQSLQNEHTGSFLQLMKEFDSEKRVLKRKRVSLTFPVAKVNQLCFRFNNHSFEKMVEKSKYRNSILIHNDKLRIVKETFIEVFRPSILQIVQEIKRVLNMLDSSEVTKIFLVGGFAESELLQDTITNSFLDYKVVVCEASDLFVLKGAVLFGHHPNVIIKTT